MTLAAMRAVTAGEPALCASSNLKGSGASAGVREMLFRVTKGQLRWRPFLLSRLALLALALLLCPAGRHPSSDPSLRVQLRHEKDSAVGP